MNKLRSVFLWLMFAPLLLSSQLACAQEEPAVKYVAGKHYEILPNPAKTADPSKIEVMEVFWYGCGHCYDFEPLVQAWKKNIDEDVVFARTPAMWDRGGVMRKHATLYYAAEALGVLDKVHGDIFEVLVRNRKLTSREKFAEIFAKHGVSEEQFNKAFDAFGTTGKVAGAEKRVQRNYRTQGTPEMVVNGKYRVSSRTAGGHAGMLSVVDYLVESERAGLGQKDG